MPTKRTGVYPEQHKFVAIGKEKTMLKKLYGAAAKAHAKKSARKGKSRPAAKKTTKKATSKGKTVLHKGYSYKSKSGKTVHVKAHREIRHK